MNQYDVLVIGSGLAGASLALRLAETCRVGLMTKDALGESNSAWAQGGIAAVVSPGDSIPLHIDDTLAAGGGICDASVVAAVVAESEDAILELEKWGVSFARDAVGEYALTREGGHSLRRVLHAGDLTGGEIQRALVRQLRQSKIDVLENWFAVDLVVDDALSSASKGQVRGVYALAPDGEILPVAAKIVVLATGGSGKVYLYTSNPDGATGDGLAMAARAGLPVSNLEFYQFHPTCLYHPGAKNFLISEAVRGEGARLVNRTGEPIMQDIHPQGDLAPRDIVARAIDLYLKESGDDCVYLDCSSRDPAWLAERFPNIYERCASFGFQMGRDPLPVVPAAHYQCGGVDAAIDGTTAIGSLYVIGECACTGLHGANRLASNSLLEAVVQSKRAADRIAHSLPDLPDLRVMAPWAYERATDRERNIQVTHLWDELRRIMSNYVGIVRSDRRLKRAWRRVRIINEEVNNLYWSSRPDRNLLELRNIGLVAELMIRCARFRQESRGLHYNRDHPDARTDWSGATILDPGSLDITLRHIDP